MVNALSKTFFKIVFLYFFLLSCTPSAQNSLLSSNSGSSNSGSSNNQTSITGQPAIIPDGITVPGGKVLAAGIENGDLLEISGECRDLGNKKNIILFQIFENTSENGFPLIDNAIDWKCQASTATTELSSGNETCFVASQGLGVVEKKDPPEITPQYPQCHNGRFSFFVRLGRAMRNDPLSSDFNDATNPRVNYLLRLKLRLINDNAPVMDSDWVKVTINRVVGKPSAKVTLVAQTMKIEADVAKFSNIKYNAFYSASGASYYANNTVSGSLFSDCSITTVSGTGAVSTACSFINSNVVPSTTTAAEFTHLNLIPGFVYAYQFMAEDFNYVYPSASGAETSGYGAAVGHIVPSVFIVSSVATTGPIRCTMTTEARSSAYHIEWAYRTDNPTWMLSAPTTGIRYTLNGCSGSAAAVKGTSNCVIQGGAAGSDYYVAVRTYFDRNGDGLATPGVDLISDWGPLGATCEF